MNNNLIAGISLIVLGIGVLAIVFILGNKRAKNTSYNNTIGFTPLGGIKPWESGKNYTLGGTGLSKGTPDLSNTTATA